MAVISDPPRRLKALRSVDEVFKALGGNRAVADMTRCQYTTVCNWHFQYKRLPAKTYLLIQGRLKREGYIADPKLFGML